MVHTDTALPIGGAHAISFVKSWSLAPASFILIIKGGREHVGVDFRQGIVIQSGFFLPYCNSGTVKRKH